MINEQIRDREVRLIGENGEQLGIMSAKDAYKLAKEAELDLVKIAPTAKPPVCKIIDYGKYRYELARKEKEAKKKQKVIEIKEVRLSPNIDENDLNTKMKAKLKELTSRSNGWGYAKRKQKLTEYKRLGRLLPPSQYETTPYGY